MKKILFVLLTGIISIILLSMNSCGEKTEKEIVSRYPNGTPQKINHFIWKGNEKVILKEIRFYANGEKELEGEYNEEYKRDGKWTYWYENGIKWSEGTFKNGLSHGDFIIRV